MGDGRGTETARGGRLTAAAPLRCAECGLIGRPGQRGWRGCRTDEPGVDEPPAVALFCPDCAEREFGPVRG
jgi:hypothetical protein